MAVLWAANPRLGLRWAPTLLAGLLPLLTATGCRAEPPGRASGLVHWPVGAPPPLQGNEPRLWVALAARLGPRRASDPGLGQPLVLEAARGQLELQDRRGQIWRGARLGLAWRWQPLPQPLGLERRVLGPFASFESADQAAQLWRQRGVAAEVAHPDDWEVWAPAAAPPPPGGASVLRHWRWSQRLVLVSPTGTVLDGPLQLRAPAGLRWRGGVYAGPFLLQPDAYGTWSLVEQVPLERYLRGVVPHEIGAGAPAAALQAQAVLARTWALGNSHRFRVDGYHLCADTQCQVYGDPRQAGAAVTTAIDASRGLVLSWQGRPIHAVYHASNGGVAAGFEEVWGGDPLPYLKPFADGPAPFVRAHPLPLRTGASLVPLLAPAGGVGAYGADHPLYRWRRRLTAAQMQAALGTAASALGEVRQLRVLKRGASGRVLALAVEGSRSTQVLRLDAIRRSVRQLPSTLFTLRPAADGAWLVEGGGFGHGAGLSQQGAVDLARRGWDRDRILAHYYPGTVLLPVGALRQDP